jgi:hypothetical protein
MDPSHGPCTAEVQQMSLGFGFVTCELLITHHLVGLEVSCGRILLEYSADSLVMFGFLLHQLITANRSDLGIV